jgi:hypothetical protein
MCQAYFQAELSTPLRPSLILAAKIQNKRASS